MPELNDENTQGQQEVETEKTYTQSEVDSLLQSEVDRRVTSALKKQEAKFAAKEKEAAKLASMNAAEKYEYELQQREEALVEKENRLALAEMTNTASKILSDKGLSLDLVDFVVDVDADITNDRISKLERAFKQSVKTEIEKRLGSQVPKKNLADADVITKETLRKMSLAELQAFAKENPELYKTLK